MKLFEFEGKELLGYEGIVVPQGIVVGGVEEASDVVVEHPVALKAQLLSGKRGKAGLIQFAENADDVKKKLQELLSHSDVTKVLVEKKLNISREFYLSITFDTWTRSVVMVLCKEGGIDIEEYKESHPDKVIIEPIDVNEGPNEGILAPAIERAGFNTEECKKIFPVIQNLFNVFTRFDCQLAEINPLVETTDGSLIAADAKLVIDDDALFRHKDLGFEERQLAGRNPTPIELAARKIDEDDHRGTAGSTFIEFEGDIAVLASGGGASITCMDALLEFGGKAANYTEYSGNPPDYKVKALTKVTLSKPGLNGLWVCGGTANFTDIYETLKGFLEGLREVDPKPDYPIVVRRAGPNDDKAFEMLREAKEKEGWDFHLYGAETPMTQTAEIIVDLVNQYKERKRIKGSDEK